MATQTDNDIGYYTLPVILSMEGVERQVSGKLAKIFGDVGKKAGRSLAAGAEPDLKKMTEAYGKLRDRAEDALGKIRVEEEKLAKARASGKTDQIVVAEERLAKARRDGLRVNREAIASYNQLEEAQKKVAQSTASVFDKIKGLGGAAASGGQEAAAGFVDGFGGPIAVLGTKAGPIGIALAATAGLGLLAGKVLADQVLAGMDQLQERANVAAKIGISVDQMRPLAKAAAEAYVNNFGESIEGNLDAVRAAAQAGLIDPKANAADVQKIVEQLSTVATVTGEDIPAAVRSAQQAIRTGLAGDATEAFDLMIKAQQSGLNVTQDLFDTIGEYSTQFRKVGINGAEALGLISQALEGGARDTDVAADALKEFSIRAINGSKMTGEAYRDLGLSFKGTTEAFAAGGDTAKNMFQEVVNRIAAIEDPAKKAQIQVALFGTQAEDLGDALNRMDLSTATTQLGDVAGATERAADTMGNTATSSFESAKRSIEVSVDGIQQSLAEVFAPSLQKIADWIVANRETIFDFFLTMGHVAIDAGEFIVRSMGEVLYAIGSISQPIGDAVGWFLKWQALNEEWAGNDEAAKRLREESEAAFSWGEGLTEVAETMRKVDASDLHKALDEAAEKAKTATKETGGLEEQIKDLDGKKVDIPVSVDTDPAKQKLMELKRQFFEAFNVPMPASPTMPAAGAAVPAGSGASRVLSFDQSLTGQKFSWDCGPGAAEIILNGQGVIRSEESLIADMGTTQAGTDFGNVAPALNRAAPGANYRTVSGLASPDQLFADVSQSVNAGRGAILNYNTGAGGPVPVGVKGSQATPYSGAIAHYVAVMGVDPADKSLLVADPKDGRQYWISAENAAALTRNRGYIVSGGGSAPGMPPRSASTPTPIPSMPPSVTSAVPNATAGMTAIDTSRIYGPGGSPDLINAFGPGYQPGIGTPGYNEYGEPGYFRADERSVREANQRAQAAQEAIAEADAAAQAARDARIALDDTPFVTEEMIAGADEDVRKAEKRARDARQEAADAATDAATTALGNFTKAKEVEKQKAAKAPQARGGMGLGGLGSIASSFLQETFGIGSWLPALDNLMPLQMADALIGAFVTPMLEASQTEGTSPGAFGIPDIAAPPMPMAGQHGGSGAPPGPTVVNINQSQNFNNSPLGWDPAQVNKERNNQIMRAPRLPVGMGG